MKAHLSRSLECGEYTRWGYCCPSPHSPGTQENQPITVQSLGPQSISLSPRPHLHLHPGRGHGRGVPCPLGATIIFILAYVRVCTRAHIHMYACVNLHLCMHAACVYMYGHAHTFCFSTFDALNELSCNLHIHIQMPSWLFLVCRLPRLLHDNSPICVLNSPESSFKYTPVFRRHLVMQTGTNGYQ